MPLHHLIAAASQLNNAVSSSSWESLLEQLQGTRIIFSKFNETWSWLNREIFERDSLYELASITVIILISYAISTYLQKQIAQRISSNTKPSLRYKTLAAIVQISTPITFYLLSLIVVSLTNVINLDDTLLTLTANLCGAWVAIQFLIIFASGSFRAKTLGFIIWCISALYLSDTLGTAIIWLNLHRVDINSLHTSVLDIISTVIIVFFLLSVVTISTKFIDHKLEQEIDITQSGRQLFLFMFKSVAWVIIVALALDLLGLNMSVITVFSGAFGLGVGFGLKNVFSNLIAGLILLVDKAVKPGDVIGINDIWGEVTALKSRYIVVVTRSGIEHLIPNEHLITQDIINLTHSSSTIRVAIPISVAYTTDLQKASVILTKIAIATPRVLQNPAPTVRINSLGDSGIQLELRVWISDPKRGVGALRTLLLKNTIEAFKASGIEIPFPQLELRTDPHNITEKTVSGSSIPSTERPTYDYK